MSDRYERAVEYLTNSPGEIVEAWRSWGTHPAGCLFAPVVPGTAVEWDGAFRGQVVRGDGKVCGCLTEIRRSDKTFGWTDELTAAIRADKRIPREPRLIRVGDLAVFAEWQRRLDTELRRRRNG